MNKMELFWYFKKLIRNMVEIENMLLCFLIALLFMKYLKFLFVLVSL